MLSVVINIKNGDKYLDRCLNTLAKFSDVVILDNYSTDNTLNIANKFSNVRLYQTEFCGMGRVRNIAASYTRFDWVLFVDCDEMLDANLVNTLLSMSFLPNTVYQFLRKNYYQHRLIDGAAWENDWVCRLYNKNEAKYSESEVHESIITTGLSIRKIEDGYIFHFPYDSVSGLLDKMKFYSELYAKQNYPTKKVNVLSLPFRTVFMFIKCYFLKMGFLYGFEGFLISCANSFGVFIKYAQLWQLYNNKKFAVSIDIHSSTDIKDLFINTMLQTKLPNLYIINISDSNLREKINQFISSVIIPYTINYNENNIKNKNHLLSDNLDFIIKVKDLNLLKNPNLLLQIYHRYINNKFYQNSNIELIDMKYMG